MAKKKKKKLEYPVPEADFDVCLKMAAMTAASLARKLTEIVFQTDPSLKQDSMKWAGICETLSDARNGLQILDEMLPQFYKIAEKRMVKAARPLTKSVLS